MTVLDLHDGDRHVAAAFLISITNAISLPSGDHAAPFCPRAPVIAYQNPAFVGTIYVGYKE